MIVPTLSRLRSRAMNCAHIDGDPDVTLYSDECRRLVEELNQVIARYELMYSLLSQACSQVLADVENVVGKLTLDDLRAPK